MKILLVGGGSGGPVAPMLAIAEHIKSRHPKAQFLLVGTHGGPEKHMAQKAGIAFSSITTGKLRRYFSWRNFITPILVVVGFFQSQKILNSFKPDCIFGTGSFVQVPLVWAAWFKRIPVVLHQQDVSPSLANKLCQWAAKKITVTFKYSLTSFYTGLGIFYKKKQSDKIVFTGNAFREELKHGLREAGQKQFNLQKDLPTLLVLGGGTGAEYLNTLILKCLPELSKSVQIIHSTGAGKFNNVQNENYHAYEFIDNMANAYAAADIVLARAGLSTITELSNLKKLSIIVPMPGTHQDLNAYLLIHNNAAIVLSQKKITLAGFVNLVRRLLFAQEAQDVLTQNIGELMPHDSNDKISSIILKLAEKS